MPSSNRRDLAGRNGGWDGPRPVTSECRCAPRGNRRRRGGRDAHHCLEREARYLTAAPDHGAQTSLGTPHRRTAHVRLHVWVRISFGSSSVDDLAGRLRATWGGGVYGGDLGAQIRAGTPARCDHVGGQPGAGPAGVLDYIRAACRTSTCCQRRAVTDGTEASSLREGCERLLELGARVRRRHAGAEPTVVATADASRGGRRSVDVVDTSGCGDAFSAGFLRGIPLGLDVVGAAESATPTAAHTAQGSAALRAYDADTVRAFIAARRPSRDLG